MQNRSMLTIHQSCHKKTALVFFDSRCSVSASEMVLKVTQHHLMQLCEKLILLFFAAPCMLICDVADEAAD